MNAAGTQVAAGGADKTLLVWKTANAKEIKKFTLAAAVNSVAFSPDGKFLAAGLADNSIHLFDLAMGKEVKSVHRTYAERSTRLLFTPKGDQLVSASADKTVQVWNVADGKSKTKLEHGAAVQALALSKDGTKIAAGGADKTVKVWTLADGKPQATITTPAAVHARPLQSRCRAAADRRRGQQGARLRHRWPARRVLPARRAGPRRCLTNRRQARVHGQRRQDGAAVAAVAGVARAPRRPGAASRCSMAGSIAIVSCGDDKTVKIWNAADGKLVRSLDAHDGPVTRRRRQRRRHAHRLAAARTRRVKVFTLAAKAGVKEDKPLVITLPAAASAVALSPNGQRIAAAVSGAKSSQVHVFDAANGKELLVLAEHAGAIPSLSFLADNRTLVSAGADKIVRLSDMNILASLDAHAGGVTSVAFHNNGTQALSAGADKTVKLWDVAKGQGDRRRSVPCRRRFAPSPSTAPARRSARPPARRSWCGTSPTARKSASWSIRPRSPTSRSAPMASAWPRVRPTTRCASGSWPPATNCRRSSTPDPSAPSPRHPSNNALVFSGSADKTVALHTMTVTRVVSAGTPLRALTVTTNGSHVLTAGDDGKIKLWNAGNGANDRTLEGGGKALHALAVSKNNVLLAAGGADQIVRIFTLNDGKLLAEIKAPGVVRNLAFTPNSQIAGRRCAPPDGAGVLQTWNVVFNAGQPLPAEFGKPVQTYRDAGAVGEIAFDSKGGLFYSGSADKADPGLEVRRRHAGEEFPASQSRRCGRLQPGRHATGNRLSRWPSARFRRGQGHGGPRHPGSRHQAAAVRRVLPGLERRRQATRLGQLRSQPETVERGRRQDDPRVQGVRGQEVREGPSRGRRVGGARAGRQDAGLGRRLGPFDQDLERRRRQRAARTGQPEAQGRPQRRRPIRAWSTRCATRRTASVW